MFTNWEQVRAWIEDNNFPHWVFYKSNPDGRDEKANDKVIDSNNFTVSDFGDKLAMTEKYLRMYGGKVYGVGFKTPNATQGGIVCEVRLEPEMQQQQPVGFTPQAVDESAIEKRIEARLRAEMERKEYERLRADLDRERKQFEEDKQSALGALTHYFAPIGRTLLQNRGLLRNVAGVDAEQPVVAQPIMPAPAPQAHEIEETEEVTPFTDEEADELFDLMARFKKVEPDYMRLIKAVVQMAESGDATYTMAKVALVK